MYIIFDSNIWISELGLNSPKGAATRLFVKQKGAKVVVPEVIKLETERHLRNELTDYIADIQKKYRQLLAVFGKLKELILPDDKAIEEKITSIFGASRLDIIEVPLCLESAKSSFMKTIDKVPPSDKDQQFKDGIIWAECLNLLKEDNVYLISADKAFYQERNYEKGLSATLASEAAGYAYKIQLYHTVSELIREIRTEIALDEGKLVQDFFMANQESINGLLSRNGFSLNGEAALRVEKYATEDPNRLYVEFEITYRCEDITSDSRSAAKLILKGDCGYLVTENKFLTIRNYGEELTFRTQDGEDKNIRNIVIFADSLVIGHKTVEHSVRHHIE
jgi:hypothetical protein